MGEEARPDIVEESGLRRAVFVVLALAFAAPLAAQDEAARQSPNPYQEEIAFELGRQLTVNVEVEGVRWAAVRVAPPEGEQPAPGVDGTVLVDLSFSNQSRRGVDLVVALLLEDEGGAPLQRLSCPEVHLGGGKVREFRHSFTASGDVLVAARRVYLFLEIQ
jgi:hypothetical protein